MQNMLGASIKLNNETLFMKAVIRNLTFDGIDSPLLHMGDEAGGMLGEMLENQIPFDRFGWFYDVRRFLNQNAIYTHFFHLQRNNSETYDGLYQMFSGLDDIYKVGQISEWQGKSNLSDFYPEGCQDLVGSAGEFFPQDRDKSSLRLALFFKTVLTNCALLLVTSPLISVVLFSSISKKRQQSMVSMALSMRLMKASGVTARQTPQTGVTTLSPI